MEISRKRKHVCAGGDRLMDLPDSLLHTILSNLTAREVVQTCALSRRWRHVWLSAPSLDIDFREFRSAADPGDAAKSHKTMLQQEEFVQFEDFADNLLCRRSTSGASLDTLRLRFECPQTTTHGRWVRRGLKCCPAALDIRHGAGTLPIPLPPVGSGCARRLKKLCLDGLGLPSDFEEQLRSEFRVLEDLEIRNCRMTWVPRIASDTLKNLTVECPQNDGKLLIVAPRLASLHITLVYRNGPSYDITVGEAPSLVEASICLLGNPRFQRHQAGFYSVRPDTILLTALCRLLSSLSNVTNLELIGFKEMMASMNPFPAPPPTVQGPMLQAILDVDNDRLPTFRNLRSLVLDECDIGDKLETLWRFLENYSPMLEKLTLQNCELEEVWESQAGVSASITYPWIWKSEVMLRIEVLAWIMVSDRVNTRDMLPRNCIVTDGFDCVMCPSHIDPAFIPL
ncbi:hypothetical protein ACQ4PT_010016 [Festuca glaucescens]